MYPGRREGIPPVHIPFGYQRVAYRVPRARSARLRRYPARPGTVYIPADIGPVYSPGVIPAVLLRVPKAARRLSGFL